MGHFGSVKFGFSESLPDGSKQCDPNTASTYLLTFGHVRRGKASWHGKVNVHVAPFVQNPGTSPSSQRMLSTVNNVHRQQCPLSTMSNVNNVNHVNHVNHVNDVNDVKNHPPHHRLFWFSVKWISV